MTLMLFVCIVTGLVSLGFLIALVFDKERNLNMASFSILFAVISANNYSLDSMIKSNKHLLEIINTMTEEEFKPTYNYVETHRVDEDTLRLDYKGYSTFLSESKMAEKNATMEEAVNDFVKKVKAKEL